MTTNHDPSHYKVVFFSSAPIGIPFLQKLADDNRFEVVWVVSQCDKAQWRWMIMCENIIKSEAKKLFQKDDYDDFITTPQNISAKSEEWQKFQQRLSKKEADFFVVIAYGKIIPENILNTAKIAPINVHGSILPKYRGASPIQSVFLNWEKKSGITIMKMDKTMDTGDIIDTLQTELKTNRTCKDLIERMKNKWPDFLNNTLWKFGKKIIWSIPQKESLSTYCCKIEKEDWLVDPYQDSLNEIYNKYRAYYLRPKIYFIHNKKRVIVEHLEIDQEIFEKHKKASLINQTNKLNSAIKNIKLKPEWKSTMNRESFQNWYLK